MLTRLNTTIKVTNRLLSPYGSTSSIRILLNMDDAMPRIVTISEPRMAYTKSFFCGRSRSMYRFIMPPFSILPPLNSEVGFSSSSTPVKFL